ncbi:MAG: UDP-3-O-(3-hydroxymyristoyl)glucosamine N-acyltransferase, partial [Vicinamibacterales bacterium]
MTLGELATALGCTVHGAPDRVITGVATLDAAGPGDLTFLANPKYTARARQSKAGAILVHAPFESPSMASVVSRNPYLDFARALALFYRAPRPAPGIHPLASVDPTASIGPGSSVGAFAVVGARVTLGRNAVLHPHVVIYDDVTIGDDFTAHAHASVRESCRIGHRVTLQNGVVIGGDGFGFAKRADGSHEKIVQSGVTVIEDDVEIQTLSSIDRAT